MKDYPVIKYTVLFIIGIILNYILPICKQNYFLYLGLTATAFVILIIFNFNKKLNPFLQYPVYFLVILAGLFISEFQKPNYRYLPKQIERQNDFTAIGKISNIELSKESELIFYLKTDSIKYRNEKFSTNISLLCRLKDTGRKLDSLSNIITPGNYVRLRGVFFKGRDRRNPGEFDYDEYLSQQGIAGILIAKSCNDLKVIKNNTNRIANFIYRVRKSIDNNISNLHDTQTASLLRGLLLADRSKIDYNTKTEFINSGVIHILAVSGLHVGYIVLIFLILFGRLNVYLKSLLTIIGLISFMVLTNSPASVVRAVIMSTVILVGFITNRSTNLFNSISLAALFILIIDPSELFKPGFQLSFAAVISIALIYPIFQKIICSIKIKNSALKNIFLFGAVSISAQIGTLPFTLIYFGKLSLIAIFTNLFIIPLAGFIVGLGIITLILNSIFPFLAFYFATTNNLFSSLLFYIVKLSGNFEFAFIWVRNFSLFNAIMFYFFIGMLIFSFAKFKYRTAKLAVSILIGFNIWLFSEIDDKEIMPKNQLSVYMIDVGQGDSFLVKFPDGKTALIDAGLTTTNYDIGEQIILPLLNYFNINKIDYGFVSHVDADHYGGFISLINANKIKKIFKPQIDTLFVKDIKYEKFLNSKNIPIEHYMKKNIEISNCRIYILNDLPDNFKTTTNGKSGLLKIVYGKNSFLFTGDLEKKNESHYVENYKKFLNSDVLKVSHHGSKTASSFDFIFSVKPKISMISDGVMNKFGHPAFEVLERLKSIGSKIYRTDQNGGLLLRSNGEYVSVVDWKNL